MRYRVNNDGTSEYEYHQSNEPPSGCDISKNKDEFWYEARRGEVPDQTYQARYTYDPGDVVDSIHHLKLSEGKATAFSGERAQNTINPAQEHHIKIQDTRVNALDKSYKIYGSRNFKKGKVFKVLWFEPYGSTGTEITQVPRKIKYGERAYQSTRRFVIISSIHYGHSLCLPIFTYYGKATAKPGVHPGLHSVVYATEFPPELQQGEYATYLQPPIKIKLESDRHMLDKASRINYSKVYTVEHNVKVSFIGTVETSFMPQFMANYHKVNDILSYSEDPVSSFAHAGYWAAGSSLAQSISTSDAYPTDYEPSDTLYELESEKRKWQFINSAIPCCIKSGEIEIEWSNDTIYEPSTEGSLSESLALYKVIASYENQLLIALALFWLCTAVRSSDQESKGQTELVSTKLFTRYVIAQDFTIPNRKYGRGLEIPFMDMALLCGCLGFVEYKEGLVADWLNAILILRDELVEDDAFQWHYESKKTLYLGTLKAGWTEKATIMIGIAQHFNGTTISHSDTKRSSSVKYVKSYGWNLGGNVAHMAFGFTVTKTPMSMPSFIQPSISNSIRDILTVEGNSGKGNHHVLVYDSDTHIGWYLPQACVVLQMAQLYLSQQKHQLVNAYGQEISLQFADPNGEDVGVQAAKILIQSLDFKIRTSSPNDTDHTTSAPGTCKYIDFRSTVERLWYLLDTVGSSLKENKPEYMKCSEIAPLGIHGVDFNELLEPKGPAKSISIRYLEVNQPWACLTNYQSTVIFCKNFGQAIIPASRGLCNPWSKVPRGKKILAMTGQTIHYFLTRCHEGLAEELKWYTNENLIQVHREGVIEPVFHTQHLRVTPTAKFRKFINQKVMERFNVLKGQNKECLISNFQLMNTISFESCFLFTDQETAGCCNLTSDASTSAEVIVLSTKRHSDSGTLQDNSTSNQIPVELLSQVDNDSQALILSKPATTACQRPGRELNSTSVNKGKSALLPIPASFGPSVVPEVQIQLQQVRKIKNTLQADSSRDPDNVAPGNVTLDTLNCIPREAVPSIFTYSNSKLKNKEEGYELEQIKSLEQVELQNPTSA
ncbi:hypothetical protein B7463_g774, partial [Scytalidium lignicola]